MWFKGEQLFVGEECCVTSQKWLRGRLPVCGLAFKFVLKSFLFEMFFPDLNRLSSMKAGVVEKEALPLV